MILNINKYKKQPKKAMQSHNGLSKYNIEGIISYGFFGTTKAIIIIIKIPITASV